MIHDENNVLADDKFVIVRDISTMSKHACLYIRNKSPNHNTYKTCCWNISIDICKRCRSLRKVNQ